VESIERRKEGRKTVVLRGLALLRDIGFQQDHITTLDAMLENGLVVMIGKKVAPDREKSETGFLIESQVVHNSNCQSLQAPFHTPAADKNPARTGAAFCHILDPELLLSPQYFSPP
jgi:hypothetical protein